MDYYERAGLLPYLDKLGFNLVGFGCTTCIGNSGPLPEEISAAVNDSDLAVVAVLSGNRNFEGRINPDVKMNYLASPPLVVAYALTGSMDVDMASEPIGTGTDGQPVYLRDIWPSPAEIAEVVQDAVAAEMFTRDYADVFEGDDRWRALGSRPVTRSPGTITRPTCGGRRTSTRCRTNPAGHRHPRGPGARPARRLGDHRPHLAGRRDQDRQPGRAVPHRSRHPAPRLQLLWLAPRQPRGDDPRHVRQHPAAEPAGAGYRGRGHHQAARRRADEHLRRLAEVHRARARR